jgi:hypothetical protein
LTSGFGSWRNLENLLLTPTRNPSKLRYRIWSEFGVIRIRAIVGQFCVMKGELISKPLQVGRLAMIPNECEAEFVQEQGPRRR